MAKTKEVKEENGPVGAQAALGSFLKETKEDHYNFEPDNNYIVPCSSLQLTSALSGGLTPGAARFVGLSGGGKSSCALDFMYHFLNTPSPKGKERRGIYVLSEGRLSKNIQDRSGIKFVKNAEEWVPGTCFVHETNIYENVFSEKRRLLGVPNCEFFWITDSVDSLIKRDDAKKPEEDSITVGGGSLITSVFLKKVGLLMAKRGHIDLYINQIRDQIKINQYEVTIPKQGKAGGPRALEHQANVVLEFLPRFGGDLIQDGKKSAPYGHWCKVRILKTDNEKYVDLKYPILYNQIGAKSVWTAFELVDSLIMWEGLRKKGAWLYFDEVWKNELIADTGLDVPEQLNGAENMRDWIDANPSALKHLFDKIKSLIE